MEALNRSSLKQILAFSRNVLQGVNQILQAGITCKTEGDFGEEFLRVAEKLTQSQYGFIGLSDSTGKRFGVVISGSVLHASTDHPNKAHGFLLDSAGIEINGICGRVMCNAKGFFINNPVAGKDDVGLPSGHPPLQAFLVTPLACDDEVIGMVGMANRPDGYRPEDLFTIEALSSAMSQTIKRRQVETKLRESDAQFQAMFDSPSVGMAQADPATGRLVCVNDFFARMLGYRPEELIGKPFPELAHPDDRQEDWQKFLRFIHGEVKTYQSEKRYIHRDGHSFWVMVTANLVRDASGKPVRSVGVILDISERRRMEEEIRLAHDALMREQNFLEAVFNALPVGVCITDEHGGVIRTNHMDERIWGRRPVTDGVGDYHEYKAWWAHSGKSISPEEWASARAVMKGETVSGQILKIQRFDGEQRIVNNSAAPVRNEDGEIIGSAVSIQDITSLWNFASELRKAKNEAEEANRAKSEFLANMSHEIRTPMTVFMAVIEQLLQIDREPEHRQLLQLAEKSSQRLHALVNDVLDFSKIEAHRVDVIEDSFNIRKCIQDCLTMMTSQAQEKNLRLKLRVSPSIPETILGDQYRLGQVLINLIGNAIKFTEAGEVKISVAPRESELVFTVSDTGIGIPDDKLGTIFDPFIQVDSSTTRRYGGTGLGLGISKGLVELMGGEIDVQSRPGQGSVFSFTLPNKHFEVTDSAVLHSSQHSEEHEIIEARILLVEDDPMVSKVLQMTLSRRPWQVISVTTGSDAVLKWSEGDFDIILMDLQMPDMDGLTATREIRQLEKGRDKKVIIIGLTAHTSSEMWEECALVGMNEVLSKPCEAAQLYKVIENFLPE